jgi:hypothetical protein
MINFGGDDETWSIPPFGPGEINSPRGREIMFIKFFSLLSIVKGTVPVPDVFFGSRPSPTSGVDAEFIESESMATDIVSSASGSGVPIDATENTIVELGNRDRVLCTHISSGRSTRYMLMDLTRLVLVSPDLTQPGFGVVRLLIPLRKVKCIQVDKTDDRILILSSGGDEIRIGFEDVKRCMLALTHLETQRMDIRRKIFEKIKKYILQFNQ